MSSRSSPREFVTPLTTRPNEAELESGAHTAVPSPTSSSHSQRLSRLGPRSAGTAARADSAPLPRPQTSGTFSAPPTGTSSRLLKEEPWLNRIHPHNFNWTFRPVRFLALCFRGHCHVSPYLNLLWIAVPPAIVLNFAAPQWPLAIFILNYIAMAPAAHILDFAGQEIALQLPHVLGVLTETALAALAEVIIFVTLLLKARDAGVTLIRHAILGSLLGNLLLCLGFCLFAGGIRHSEQVFHAAISEVGASMILVASVGLVLPAIFNMGVKSSVTIEDIDQPELARRLLRISRAASVILLVAYVAWLVYHTKSHHGIVHDLLRTDVKLQSALAEQREKAEQKAAAALEQEQEQPDLTASQAQAREASTPTSLLPPSKTPTVKAKLTMTEALVALAIAVGCVVVTSISLVGQIGLLVLDRNISDSFVGLILLPLVEKAAGHLSAVDEAWGNQMNLALSHVLGASVQTALMNTPIIVLLGWCVGVDMNLNFEPFEMVALILSILIVGNFLRDGRSNYLEGALCIVVYVMIAFCAFEMPNPEGFSLHY